MNDYICLDSSTIIKVLTWEQDSEKALNLFNTILEKNRKVILPDFAWAEIGTVLRKKVRFDAIKLEEAQELWEAFLDIGIIQYVENKKIMSMAWEISNNEDLPTLYDAAYIAVAKLHSNDENICEFWTADEKLVNSVKESKKYLKRLGDL